MSSPYGGAVGASAFQVVEVTGGPSMVPTLYHGGDWLLVQYGGRRCAPGGTW